ncbi:hypothetical protein, partial [Bacteroides sp.]|uniref:hypothetical protein n=1 Tax=Bacteroides sp. TaxID=29523 RepID=UPI003D15357F
TYYGLYCNITKKHPVRSAKTGVTSGKINILLFGLLAFEELDAYFNVLSIQNKCVYLNNVIAHKIIKT